jgi:hypothetical protein
MSRAFISSAQRRRNKMKFNEYPNMNSWLVDPRNQYRHLSDALFKTCYNYLSDKCDTYDEIAEEMSDVADFAEDIISASKH